MVRYYRLKNYLNASHFVIFNGEKGETHPHTWEFSALLISTSDSITKFTDTEKEIEKIFSPYQNCVLNEMEPFDNIVPSLESITEYFVKRISEAVKPFGYRLTEFEGSETPVRTYGVLVEESDYGKKTSASSVVNKSAENFDIDAILSSMERRKDGSEER